MIFDTLWFELFVVFDTLWFELFVERREEKMSSRPGGNPGFIESIFIRNGTPTITKHVVEHISENVFVIS